jgi:hypothetical protein
MTLGLLLILLAAKAAMLWGRAAPLTAWSAIAWCWQDVAVVLAFAAVARWAPRRIADSAYWAIVLYTAINIPVSRAVSTPLTWPMLRAARGPLADSMLRYVTPLNAALIAGVLAAAVLFYRTRWRMPAWTAALAIPIVLLGPAARTRVDTHGMDRNAVTALLPDGLPRSDSAALDWRSSPFAGQPAEDLSRFRGATRGFNIVMVSLESTAAQYLALYGSGQDVMPRLGGLAANALVFDNAYAVYPESIKGLFSVLCSTFPAFDSSAESYQSVECQSVAETLADHGYRTAMFHSGRFGYLGMESIIQHRGYQVLEDAGAISGNVNSSFGVDEPATVARMLAWIDSLPPDQRFFLTYLPIAGHHPYATPGGGPFRGESEIDQYRNALHFGDASLGALIDGLRARGLEDRMLWVIYGDHGEAFGQHPGNYGHTFFLYDENVRVPLVVAAPGAMRGLQRVRKVVSLVDVAPTVLDLAGIAAPSEYQGRTMLDAAPRMALFFADYSLGILGLRDGPWKYLYEIESGRPKLFDMEHDPGERLDVAPRNSERARWYGGVVRGWGRAQREYLARAAAVGQALGLPRK